MGNAAGNAARAGCLVDAQRCSERVGPWDSPTRPFWGAATLSPGVPWERLRTQIFARTTRRPPRGTGCEGGYDPLLAEADARVIVARVGNP